MEKHCNDTLMALAELPPEDNKPANAPDLLASFRRRIATGGPFPTGGDDVRRSQYGPALLAVQQLLERRRNVGGSLEEFSRLEALARDLQQLARGF